MSGQILRRPYFQKRLEFEADFFCVFILPIMNMQQELEQNLKGSPVNIFEKWFIWHGMTQLHIFPSPKLSISAFSVIDLMGRKVFFWPIH